MSPDEFVCLLPDTLPNHDRTTTMRDVIKAMSAEERAAFGQAMEESQHSTVWQRLLEDFAAVAWPDTARWPEPPPSLILDEIDVRTRPVYSVVCLTDGRLYLRVMREGEMDPVLMTTSEFLFYCSLPVRRFVDMALRPRAASLQRAVEVLTAPGPIEWQVQIMTADDAVDTKIVYARTPSQILEWSRRHYVRVLAATPMPKETSDAQ